MTNETSLDEREELILKKLGNHPEGLGFNELHREVDHRMADKTLTKRLQNLQDEGLVEQTPENPRKGEKITYRIPDGTDKLEEIDQHIKSIAMKEAKEFTNIIKQWEADKYPDSELFTLLNHRYMNLVGRTFLVAYVDSFNYGHRTRRRILLKAFEVCIEAHEYAVKYLQKKQSEKNSSAVLDEIVETFTECQLYPIPEHSEHSDAKVI